MGATLAAVETVRPMTQRNGNDGMPRTPKPATKTVRVHLDVAQMIDTCAAAEGQSAPEWLSELLRPILKERLPKAVEKLVQQHKPKK